MPSVSVAGRAPLAPNPIPCDAVWADQLRAARCADELAVALGGDGGADPFLRSAAKRFRHTWSGFRASATGGSDPGAGMRGRLLAALFSLAAALLGCVKQHLSAERYDEWMCRLENAFRHLDASRGETFQSRLLFQYFGEFCGEYLRAIDPSHDNLEQRMALLLVAQTISPGLTQDWLRGLPIDLRDRLLDAEMCHFLRLAAAADTGTDVDLATGDTAVSGVVPVKMPPAAQEFTPTGDLVSAAKIPDSTDDGPAPLSSAPFPDENPHLPSPQSLRLLLDAVDSLPSAIRERPMLPMDEIPHLLPEGGTTHPSRGEFLSECLRNFGSSSRGQSATLRTHLSLMGQLFTAERAREFGIISSEFQMPEGKTKIQVLCIGFYGVDNLAKTREAAIDVLGGTPPLLQEAENFTNQRLKTLQRYVAADVCVVPYFIGHSMGGMVAQAMGAAFNAGSVALNPLGMGSGCQGFVEKKARGALGRAMDAAHASMHIAFCSDGDWLRPPIRKPILGQPYRMELAAEFAKDSSASIHNGSVRQYRHWWKQRG